ncbi:MAG: CvpA family protein [Odoribacteraceae bacterium]|jgi:membrane protein required for colicin V production|nr:CvpA family protein [Odoribacteraceae bacterium]
MNYVDIILLIPLAYGAFRGFSRGLIVEVATLLALILGVYFALRWSALFEGVLQEYFTVPGAYSYYIAFAIIFLLVVVAIHLLGKLLTKIAHLIALGLLNRLLGTLFGVLKIAIVLCAVLFLIDAIDTRYGFISEETKKESLLYGPLVRFANGIYQAVIHP